MERFKSTLAGALIDIYCKLIRTGLSVVHFAREKKWQEITHFSDHHSI